MNQRFAISVAAIFVASMLLGMVVHGMLLAADYIKLAPGMFRTGEDAQPYFGYMIAAHLAIAVAVTWIYRQGRDDRPWLGQGLRFGIALALLTSVATYVIYYAVQPMPSDVVAQQVVFDSVAKVILGLVAAAVNRDAPSRRPA